MPCVLWIKWSYGIGSSACLLSKTYSWMVHPDSNLKHTFLFFHISALPCSKFQILLKRLVMQSKAGNKCHVFARTPLPSIAPVATCCSDPVLYLSKIHLILRSSTLIKFWRSHRLLRVDAHFIKHALTMDDSTGTKSVKLYASVFFSVSLPTLILQHHLVAMAYRKIQNVRIVYEVSDVYDMYLHRRHLKEIVTFPRRHREG